MRPISAGILLLLNSARNHIMRMSVGQVTRVHLLLGASCAHKTTPGTVAESSARVFFGICPQIHTHPFLYVDLTEQILYSPVQPGLAHRNQTMPPPDGFLPRRDGQPGKTRICKISKSDWSSFLRRLDELGVGYARRGDVEPSRFKQLFGAFTFAKPQTKTAL